MKSVWTCFFIGILLAPHAPQLGIRPEKEKPLPVTRNIFIITTDGLRWQEVFSGADSAILHREKYTPDHTTLKMQFWAPDPEQRRARLMPFLWNVVATKGQVYGNRIYGNKVDVANAYAISYPGYNEMMTGNTDYRIATNKKRNNPNTSVLEFLNTEPDFAGRVAVFSSWDVFPYILNSQRSGLPVFSGYTAAGHTTEGQQVINRFQEEGIAEKKSTRYDQLTFLAAKEYLQLHQPRVLFLGLGETDEFAHEGRYDLYLQQASRVDAMIAELWHWVQTTPGYKDNTTFIITTDHGRGSRAGNWTAHGEFISGSSQAWLAVMGPGIDPAGEIREEEQHYLQQVAQTVARLAGKEFKEAGAASLAFH